MFLRWTVWFALCLAGTAVAFGQQSQTFKLTDGTVISGRPISYKEQFIQVALEAGGYTNVYWARLSQETLEELTKSRDARAAGYATVFLDPAPSERSRATPPRIDIKPVPRLERPNGGSLFASPVMLVVFLLVYAASIYAGYEISIYRQQPAALVCVAAAVVPILAPAVFLAMPTRRPETQEAPVETGEAPPVEEAAVDVAETTEAAAPPPPPAAPQPVVYPRGQFTFNRRFFETKFAGFLKIVPGESERDKVIHINSARGEYTGQRLSKVESNELYLQIRKGNASEDVMIPFSEIYEVQVRPAES